MFVKENQWVVPFVPILWRKKNKRGVLATSNWGGQCR